MPGKQIRSEQVHGEIFRYYRPLLCSTVIRAKGRRVSTRDRDEVLAKRSTEMGDYTLRGLLYIRMGWVLILLMSGTIQIFGQTATGGVLGTVTDPSGAVIPGVTITLESTSRGFSTVVTTSSSGTYAFLAV